MDENTNQGAEALGASHDHPFDAPRTAAQIETVSELLGETPRRVLELGCGGGRVLAPLAAAGYECIGVDSDGRALDRCRAALRERDTNAELIEMDFTAAWPEQLAERGAPFDAVLCLGNTFMMVADVDLAVALLRRVAGALRPAGLFIIDDIAQEYWPEVIQGYWCNGITEDNDTQMVWSADDAVFALRRGDEVDDQSWSLKPGERRYRLWTTAALTLAGRLAGLSVQPWQAGSGVTVLQRDEDGSVG